MNVAVVGASDKPERYSHQAVNLLAESGHHSYPVHPSLDKVAGIEVVEGCTLVMLRTGQF